MRRTLFRAGTFFVLGIVAVVFAFVACAPAPSPTPPATVIPPPPSPSPSPSPTPVASPTPLPPPTPTGPPVPTGPTDSVSLTAQNLSFDQKTVIAIANTTFTVNFVNRDAVMHNFALYETDTATTPLFQGDNVPGGGTATFQFTAPAKPGTYYFRCGLHAFMSGTFVVQ